MEPSSPPIGPTLTPEAITAAVIRLAAEQVGADAAEITAATHLFHDLNFDSLDIVEFTMNIEEEFGVSVPDEAAQHVKTIGDAVELLAASVDAQ